MRNLSISFSLLVAVAAWVAIPPRLSAQTPLAPGLSVAGTLARAGQQDVYTFNGAAGDAITARLVRGSGSWHPNLELWGPSGTVKSAWDYYNVVSLDAKLPGTGMYMLIVSSHDGTGTGGYNVAWQKLNNPSNAPVLDGGQQVFTKTGSSGHIGLYTFSAAAGDVMTAKLVRTAGSWYPSLELYDPTGARLASNWSYYYVVPVDAKLQNTGQYTLVVTVDSGTDTGGYSLVWQNLNNPSNPTMIGGGQQVFSSLETPGRVGLYTFVASAGDVVTARMVRTSGSWHPNLELYGPAGLVGSNWSYYYVVSVDAKLSVAGPYTLIVREYDGPGTGGYSLIWQRVNNPSNPVTINCGQQITASLTPAGRMGFYSFTAVAGDTISARLVKASGSWYPRLELYGPAGFLKGDWSYYSTAAVSAQATQTGAHTLIVSDNDGPGTGDYTLVQTPGRSCLPTPNCDFLLSPESQVVPAAAGSGTIGVSTADSCPWSAASNAPYLTVTAGASGTGPGTVRYSVAANTSASQRSGTITIAQQTATVMQSGTAPLFTVNPSSLAFSFRAGDPARVQQVLSIFTSATALSFTAAAATTSGGAWLSISPTNGSAPANLLATIDASRLTAGSYSGSISVTAPTAVPPMQTVPVALTITAVGTPRLGVDAGPLVFAAVLGGSAQTAQREVDNLGTGPLDITVTVQGGGWLTVTPGSGTTTQAQPVNLTIAASPAGLEEGTYTATVWIRSAAGDAKIPVTMTVSRSGALILLSQTGLSLVAVAGGGTPPPQSFGILNEGQVPLDWTAKAVTLSGGAWLKVSPGSGHVVRNLLDVSMVDVTVDHSGLAPGEYYGRVEVTAAAANSPQYLMVLLLVLPEGSDPGPEVRPAGLIFVGGAGSKPAPQTVTITNVIGKDTTYNSSQLTFDGGRWLAYSPLTAKVAPNLPASITVQVDNTGLGAGVRRGVLTLLFDQGRAVTVQVLNVSTVAAATAAKNGIYPAAACQTPDLLVEWTSLRDEFVAAVGQPVALRVKVVDGCGNPLVPESGASTPVSTSFSNGDSDIRLVHEGNGQWAGTWRPINLPGAGGTVTATVHAAYVRLGSQQTLQTGVAQLMGTLRPRGTPIVPPGALLHAASFAASAPVAPGGLISIFGTNLADRTNYAAAPPLPSSMDGTEVDLGGVPLPLLYSSAGQINAQVPFGLSGNTQYQVVVQRGSALSVPESFTVAAAEPGIFTTNMQGTGQGVIMKSDQITLAQTATPAARGEVVVIYCSGLGAVNPPVKQGDAPTTASRTVNEATVTIGGVKADVQYAGVTPGYAGLYQVNATVPVTVAPGNAVPVTITVAGQTSNTVTIAVK